MSQVDVRRECEKHSKKVGRKYRRDAKLQELERQLEFAESRCGTLKQQLDYIKLLYKCRKDTTLERQRSKEEGHGDGSVVNRFTDNELPKWNHNFVNREDGDAPALMKQSSYSNTTTTNSSNKPNAQDKHEGKKKSPKPKINLKLLKVKKKSCRKVKKRRRLEDAASSKVSNASSQTQSHIWQAPVVEIYKNSSLNAESESGLELFAKSRRSRTNEALRPRANDKHGSCKQSVEVLEEVKAKSCNCISPKREGNFFREEGMQTDVLPDFSNLIHQQKQTDLAEFLNRENTAKAESACLEPLKSYCQPTISSKRKQVERDIYSNLTNLNIRNIPFIAAKSTAPSHNIGVNIQQVLSIIKKRQPLNENLIAANDTGKDENPIAALLSSRKMVSKTSESVSAPATGISSSLESKKRTAGQRTSLSHWKSNSEISGWPSGMSNDKPDKADTEANTDWSLKVDKLKNVLVFLHEDFTSLSLKYKRLQKKLTKRNITKTDAKDELSGIERDLEKKEEEIIVVIALYKEVLNLREELKKLQKKYSLITSGRSFMMDGLRQSSSAHTQMTALLRKIQNFQDKLKG